MLRSPHRISNDRGLYRSTVDMTVGFSASSDSEAMHRALHGGLAGYGGIGVGTDEKSLIGVLARRINRERQQICENYRTSYNKLLIDDVLSDTSHDFQDLLQWTLKDTSELLAKALFNAMDKMGTRERVLNEVLLSCNNGELAQVKNAYKQLLISEGIQDDTRTLVSDVQRETSSDYKEALLLILEEQRDELTVLQMKELLNGETQEIPINKELALRDAKTIYDCGEGRMGTNEKRISQVFACRLPWQIKAMDEAYQSMYGKPVLEALKSETSMDYKRFLEDAFEYATDRPTYYAKMFNWCIDRVGTRDFTLQRLVITRSEIDLGDIAIAYKKLYERELIDDVRSDTSGDYRKMLCAFFGVMA